MLRSHQAIPPDDLSLTWTRIARYIILICRYQCIFVPGRDFRQDVTVYWEASWLERGERHLDTPSIIHYMHDELMTYKIEFVERKKEGERG